MKNPSTTTQRIVSELSLLRRRITELEASQTERKRAEEALRQSEERYRALFESKLDGVLVIDQLMKPLLANQAAADMFGFDSVEEALEANLVDFILPEEREQVLDVIAKDMFEKDLRQINEFRLLNKAGSILPKTETDMPTWSESGGGTGSIPPAFRATSAATVMN